MRETVGSEVANIKFSISFLNLIPQTMRDRIPGYDVLSKPVPGLNFLDQNLAPESKFGAKRQRRNIDIELEQSEKQKTTGPTILNGELVRGKTTSFAIQDVDFAIDENTLVVGQPIVGRLAKATLKTYPNGQWRAVSISMS